MAEDRTLESRVASLETSVGNLVTTFDRFISNQQTQMESVFRKLDNQGKPNYTLLVSVLGLVFMIVTGLGGLFVLPLRTDLQHTRDGTTAADKRQQESLAALDIRTAKEVEKLDERLQREYQLINLEVKTRFENVNSASIDRYDRNQKDIGRLTKFQDIALEEGLRRVLKQPEQQANGHGKEQP